MQFEEFGDCLSWWKHREENERAWKVRASDVLKYDERDSLISVNLDIRNPHAQNDLEHTPPDQLVEVIFANETKILETVKDIRNLLKNQS